MKTLKKIIFISIVLGMISSLLFRVKMMIRDRQGY